MEEVEGELDDEGVTDTEPDSDFAAEGDDAEETDLRDVTVVLGWDETVADRRGELDDDTDAVLLRVERGEAVDVMTAVADENSVPDADGLLVALWLKSGDAENDGEALALVDERGLALANGLSELLAEADASTEADAEFVDELLKHADDDSESDAEGVGGSTLALTEFESKNEKLTVAENVVSAVLVPDGVDRTVMESTAVAESVEDDDAQSVISGDAVVVKVLMIVDDVSAVTVLDSVDDAVTETVAL